ncbi:hypothetical protein B0H11DRAFT_1942711 [Mycena galericulata]|nr:hypothetical protein B0H11DRAFT_1942711 [Mycena galericulata]
MAFENNAHDAGRGQVGRGGAPVGGKASGLWRGGVGAASGSRGGRPGYGEVGWGRHTGREAARVAEKWGRAGLQVAGDAFRRRARRRRRLSLRTTPTTPGAEKWGGEARRAGGRRPACGEHIRHSGASLPDNHLAGTRLPAAANHPRRLSGASDKPPAVRFADVRLNGASDVSFFPTPPPPRLAHARHVDSPNSYPLCHYTEILGNGSKPSKWRSETKRAPDDKGELNISFGSPLTSMILSAYTNAWQPSKSKSDSIISPTNTEPTANKNSSVRMSVRAKEKNNEPERTGSVTPTLILIQFTASLHFHLRVRTSGGGNPTLPPPRCLHLLLMPKFAERLKTHQGIISRSQPAGINIRLAPAPLAQAQPKCV